MVARHPKVGNQAMDVVHTVVAHPVRQIAEVAAHKRKAFVAFGNIAFGIGILVEAVKMTVVAQAAQNFAAVTTTAKGDINIGARRVNVTAVDAFVK